MKWNMHWDWKIKVIFIAFLLGFIFLLAVMLLKRDLNPKTQIILPAPIQEKPLTFLEKMKQHPNYALFTAPDLLDQNTILAYYGHPKSKTMGIVGRYSKEELFLKLKEQAAAYKTALPQKKILPAFYLIYATCQPKGNILRIPKELLLSYLDFALEHGILVYLDHQIGKYKPEDAILELLPFLQYPNVHLAIDVEWRTTRPMKKIGSIKAEELNLLQKIMRDYMLKHEIPGRRQLVFHQFKPKMVQNIQRVKANFDPVFLIHSTSGWGPPSLKIDTHATNAKVQNIPLKAFKLWYYYSDKKGIHYDDPLMNPKEVLQLKPTPSLIIYQ